MKPVLFRGMSQIKREKFLKHRLAILALVFAAGCSLVSTRPDPAVPEERQEMVEAYLSEFCSSNFKEGRIATAIRQVMMRLPAEALLKVLDRRRPVLFTEIYDAGTARFASTSEIIVTPYDKPAFQEGMTILKISTALEKGPTEAIMGIVAHELAHRVLDHVRRGEVSCDAEREANRLIKSWGFTKEYEAASKEFGHEKEGGGVASCQEKKAGAKVQ
jgi:hypothetical protein